MRAVVMSFVLILSLALTTRSTAAPAPRSPGGVLGTFMVAQLASYSDAYWARVAGRDTDLPPRTNGHDEFAARWTKDVLASLHGLHAGVIRQSFPTPGFRGLPTQRTGMNVVVTVPGSKHPERAVVIGTHYDGEPTSHGSANDDTSGAVIMLALARALGATWRSQGPPSLTVEFVLFDAEEQGLVGSTYFTSLLGNRSVMPRPVVMLNEEQSGIAYPVRPFGLIAQDPLPSYVSTVARLPAFMGKAQPIDSAAASRLKNRAQKAIDAVFPMLRAAYSPLQYRGGTAPVFTDGDRKYVQTGPSNECCSDNDPFDLHGIPNLTFSGNYDFYDPSAKPWSYPFDQPLDTFTAMACDTGGSPGASPALAAALDLPYTLSVEMIRAYAPPTRGQGVVVFSTAGRVGKRVQLTAVGGTPVRWSFGDGSTSTARSPSHVYTHAGTYHVRLQAESSTTQWTLSIPKHAPAFHSLFGVLNPPRLRSWQPEELQHVAGCH